MWLVAFGMASGVMSASVAAEPTASVPALPPPPLPPAAPVMFEAESGQLGADCQKLQRDGAHYLTAKTPGAGNKPAGAERLVTYKIRFASSGDYELYARVRVGPDGANDDSFYFGRSLGKKDLAREDDWMVANNLGGAGTASEDDIVGSSGTPVTGKWNWINISQHLGPPGQVVFHVEKGQLEQTFQIGVREDGLDIDKLAFGPARISHRVSDLEKRRPGTYVPPKPPPPPHTPKGPAVALGKRRFLGGAFSPAQTPNFAAYFNQVTPENGGKWGAVESERDVMVWTELDASYKFAKDHAFPFKLHVLIWGNQQPSWMEKLSAKEQREEIEEWYAELAKRYPALDYIEVVNEPLHDPPSKPGDGGGNYVAALGGDGKTGWDWVITSFELARKYFPRSQLMINDFSILNVPADTERYKAIIELLQARRLIDALGIQGHSFSTTVPIEVQKKNLDVLAKTGLPIFVTELDIDGATDERQLAEYQRIFPMFWEHPAVRGVTLWGYRPGMWRTTQGANLAYANGAERPAFVWLQSYVKGKP